MQPKEKGTRQRYFDQNKMNNSVSGKPWGNCGVVRQVHSYVCSLQRKVRSGARVPRGEQMMNERGKTARERERGEAGKCFYVERLRALHQLRIKQTDPRLLHL